MSEVSTARTACLYRGDPEESEEALLRLHGCSVRIERREDGSGYDLKSLGIDKSARSRSVEFPSLISKATRQDWFILQWENGPRQPKKFILGPGDSVTFDFREDPFPALSDEPTGISSAAKKPYCQVTDGVQISNYLPKSSRSFVSTNRASTW